MSLQSLFQAETSDPDLKKKCYGRAVVERVHGSFKYKCLANVNHLTVMELSMTLTNTSAQDHM